MRDVLTAAGEIDKLVGAHDACLTRVIQDLFSNRMAIDRDSIGVDQTHVPAGKATLFRTEHLVSLLALIRHGADCTSPRDIDRRGFPHELFDRGLIQGFVPNANVIHQTAMAAAARRIRPEGGFRDIEEWVLQILETDRADPHPRRGDANAAAGDNPRPANATQADAITPIEGFAGIHLAGPLQAELSHVDPLADDWDTEAFSERASHQLKMLAALVREDASGSDDKMAAIADAEFSGTRLRPTSLQRDYQDRLYEVHRYVPSASDPAEIDHSGPEGLRSALDQLRSDLATNAPLDFHFKIVRVNRLEGSVETLIVVELSTTAESFIVQQSAHWNCEWTLDPALPKLRSIQVARFEEVRTPNKLFTDDTATILAGNSSYEEHLVFSFDFWRQTLDWRFGMEIAGPHGLSVADVNGDGLDDLFYCETGGLPNRLFVQMPDGTAEDRSAASGLDYLEPTHSALFVDLDNDGDQDAVLASGRFILFLQNDGSGQFTRRLIHSTAAMARSMAAADFDLDGDLDLYVCGYFPRESVGEGVGLGRPVPYHDANNGVQNCLLANQGDWTFTDVTQAVGLDVNNRRFSFAASWEDYDNDGDADLYVANDFGRNNLYRNDQGQFVDVASMAGVEDMSAGMSVSWGDYDRDGLMDIYVGNMFSSAGNRITYQRKFRDDEEQETRAKYQRHARGNTLFRNRGDASFEDVSEAAAVTMGRWSWSSNFVDINNDGWDDLLVGNGMVTSADDPGDL